MELLHYEDFSPGQVFDLGSREVSKEEIVEFARQWDPQAFHIDEDAGRKTPFGTLIGSGVHSWAIAQRLAVDGLLGRSACVASPGYEHLHLLKPLLPGATLRLRITIKKTAVSASRPEIGKVTMLYELLDRSDVPILDALAMIFFRRREGSIAAP